jgi:uncharacterized membrane protein YhaH (DUF805 family)
MTSIDPIVPAPASAPLDKPLYGATFAQAIQRFFKKYATFSGRASRSEYWWVALFIAAVLIVIWVPGFIVGTATGTPSTDAYGRATITPGPAFIPFPIIGVLFYLAVLIPGIAVTVRRLHDGGFSGGFFFLSFIPSVGGLIIFILALLESKPEGARFDAGATVAPAAPPAPPAN